MEEITNRMVTWGAAGQSLDGAEFSGDAYFVKTFDGKTLVAAIDGLGHGKEAADAAGITVATLADHFSEDVISLLRRCHEELTRTRGVVMSVASFNAADNSMTWMGVGNVSGLLLRNDRHAKASHESLFLSGGVVGYHLPSLRSSTLSVNPGDTLIFFTDGIRSGLDNEVNIEDPPQRTADMIMTNFNRKTDDALVIVVRYSGYPHER